MSLSLAKAVNVVFVGRKLCRKMQTHVLEWVFWVYDYEYFATLISDAFVWFFDLMAIQTRLKNQEPCSGHVLARNND